MRTFAIFGVVLAHILSGRSLIIKWPDVTLLESVVYSFFYFISILSVPIFLFITGYLFLDRDYDKNAVIRFYKKNFLGLYIVYIIWFICYAFFENIVGDYSLTFHSIFNILTLRPDRIIYDLIYSFHLWYFPVILRIYLFIPLIAILLKKFLNKLTLFIYILWFLYIFIPPMLSVIGYSYNYELYRQLRFEYDEYFMYVLCGYFIKQNFFKGISNVGVISIFIMSLLSSILMLVNSLYFNLPFDVLTVFVAATALMIITERYYKRKTDGFMLDLSVNSLAIYIIHLPILAMFYYAIFLPNYGEYFRLLFISFPVLTLFPIIIFLSNTLVNFLKKSKFLSKYVLYMR